MCLYVDQDGSYEHFDDGVRTARKQHRCDECGRTIETGERYHWSVGLFEGDLCPWKGCAHCMAVVDVGVALTGCPRVWHITLIYDLDPDIGFVGNILYDEGHDLSDEHKALMLATVTDAKNGWRDPDGQLLPLPSIGEEDGAL